MSEPRSNEIVIEYNRAANRNTYFPPCDGPSRVYGSVEVIGVRSAIIPTRSGSRPPDKFTEIQLIPGQRVHVDAKGMTARITDALADKANARILEQVKHAQNSDTRHFMPECTGAEEDFVYKLHAAEDLHNWLFWMARHVEEGHATVVQGTLPKSDDLRLAGDIRAPLADPRVVRAEFGGKYLPKVDANQEFALAGAK